MAQFAGLFVQCLIWRIVTIKMLAEEVRALWYIVLFKRKKESTFVFKGTEKKVAQLDLFFLKFSLAPVDPDG